MNEATRKKIISEHMAALGRRGGEQRAKNLSKRKLSKIGKLGGRPRKVKPDNEK